MPKTKVVMKRAVVANPSMPGFRPGTKYAKKLEMEATTSMDPGKTMSNTISKYVGSDWMDKLETVIGHLSTIDDERYKEVIDKITTCETNMRICYRRICKNIETTEAFNNALNLFIEQSALVDLGNKTYIMKKNKKGVMREVIANGYIPDQLVKTDWFNSIKLIEREIYRYISKLFISPDGESKSAKTSKERKDLKIKYDYAAYQELIEKYPNLKDLYSIYGIKPSNEIVYNAFLDMQKYSNIIINLLLTPLYDVKSKVEKSYDKDLAKSFKSTIDKGFATRDLIIELLTNFAYAQYKCKLTGNSKFLIQMLDEELTEGALASMDSGRFLDVIDSINTDTLTKGSKVINFTVKSKDLMKKMLASDGKMDKSMLTEIKELIAGDEEDSPEVKEAKQTLQELPEEIEKALTKYDDIFDTSEEDAEEETQ